MKAEIIYENGWLLILPIDGHAPLLFLEWLDFYNAGECPIHKVIRDYDCIKIRLIGTKQTTYESALKYINDNL
jgi:hypothetical protein